MKKILTVLFLLTSFVTVTNAQVIKDMFHQ